MADQRRTGKTAKVVGGVDRGDMRWRGGKRPDRTGPPEWSDSSGRPGGSRPADSATRSGAERTDDRPGSRITLITKPGCHLCDDAREVVARVAADLDLTWIELDIDADQDLAERYWEQIPVTLVDDLQHDFWRVDEARLRAALGSGPPRPL
jgi:hypothetical protein